MTKEHRENYYLQTASDLVSKGAMDSAIQLLVDANGELPDSTRIINVLGKLYLKTNRPKEAAACFEKSLKINIIDDVPTEADFCYLSEQAESLTESEYSYDEPDKYIPPSYVPKKPQLSLSKNDGSTESKKPEITRDFIKSENIIVEKNTTIEQSIDESSSEDTHIHKIVVIEPEPVLQLNKFLDIQDDVDEGEISLEDDWAGEVKSSEEELLLEEEDDLIEENLEEPDLLDSSIDTDDEVDIYDFWDEADELEEGVDDVSFEEGGVLDTELTKEGRARQVAIALVDRVGWEIDDVDFITEVFIENGWGQARAALEREINLGLVREELELAFYIKCLWKECDRYWIAFPRRGSVKETTDATFKNCSWKQVLRLVRIFPDIPAVEEITDFLESEFEYWYADTQLRIRFRSYSDYLFKYRLNDSIHTINISDPWRFELALENDELSSDCFSLSHSDEMKFLQNNGIDVFGRDAPKNYYATDERFDYYQQSMEEKANEERDKKIEEVLYCD